MTQFDFALSIGGAAGQGIATPGNVLARLFVRQGLHFYAYNAYQSIIRGGHILLTVRASDRPLHTHGDGIDLLLCLNQDTMNRHLRHLARGGRAVFNSDSIAPGAAPPGVELCPLPVAALTDNNRNKLVQNTVALGAIAALLRLDFELLEAALEHQFGPKGKGVVRDNVDYARRGYTFAQDSFEPFDLAVPELDKPLAVWSGNQALAMGGAAAGVKFYAAYPMSPSTGVLHWMAQNGPELGIMVRQAEDEIAVATMTIGAAHTGCRAMCATSGGGFALMSEALGMAGMMEVPCVFINVQRAGPSTGVPTKTEQGDLWQVLGASQGDFERLIVAPRDALDAFNTVPELFNLVDKAQCPGIIISDLLLSEGTFSIDPALLDMHPAIDRGELITEPAAAADDGAADPPTRQGSGYRRYADTESGISPRAVPGTPGYVHVAASDEHDEDGVLISDEFTDPHKRRKMVEKRSRKMRHVAASVPPPELEGPETAEVTLVGWGSTYGVITEAIEQLAARGITANHLHVKWIVPFHAEAVSELLDRAKRVVVVENNYSGQFARYLRSETGIKAGGFVRKYDGEPFMPHHVADGIEAILRGGTETYVPYQEFVV